MFLEDWFKELANAIDQNRPLVCYRLPNKNKLNRFIQNSKEVKYSKDFKESGFIFSAFNSDIDPILFDENHCDFKQIDMDKNEIELNPPQSTFLGASKNMISHINLVNKGIEGIKSNEFQKVVLSRIEEVKTMKKSPVQQFKILLSLYPSAFVYLWFHPEVGMWLGATPETLIHLNDRQFSTMALAGTQKYTGTIDVNWSDKEKEEQAIVTRVIETNCKPFSNQLNIGSVETVRAGGLVHLKTNITGSLKSNEDFKRLVNQLHPTPAVCGYPLEESKAFILEHEGYEREFYTGFLGELNRSSLRTRNRNPRNVENNVYRRQVKETKLFVNLRCAQIKNDSALIYVGGGITIDSVAAKEWEETVNKSQTMAKALI